MMYDYKDHDINKQGETEGLYTLTILTKQNLERHSDRGGLDQQNWAGYHYHPMSMSECLNLKKSLEKENKYNGEDIAFIKIHPDGAGMGTF